MIRVCAVVLNWNGFSDTVECLESLMPMVSDSAVSVVVVDNASTDDSAVKLEEWLRAVSDERGLTFISGGTPALDAHLAFIRSKNNLGYAGGNNLGIRYALECGCEFVWVLNNDTVLHEDALGCILKCADDMPDAGIIGSTIVDYGGERVQCAGGATYIPLLTLSRSVLENEPMQAVIERRDHPRIDYVCGAAMLLRAEALRKVGLLNEEYFLYFEELDFARRAAKSGFRAAWCPLCVVFHKGGAAAGSRSSSNSGKSALSEYHSNLSALKFTRNFYPWLLPFVFVTRFFLKVLKCIVHGEFYLFRPLLGAYGDFLLGKRGR